MLNGCLLQKAVGLVSHCYFFKTSSIYGCHALSFTNKMRLNNICLIGLLNIKNTERGVDCGTTIMI